jgi:hypothetical protein
MQTHGRFDAALGALRLPEEARDSVIALTKVAVVVRHLNAVSRFGHGAEAESLCGEVAKDALMLLGHLAAKHGISLRDFTQLITAAAADLDSAAMKAAQLFATPAAGGVQ